MTAMTLAASPTRKPHRKARATATARLRERRRTGCSATTVGRSGRARGAVRALPAARRDLALRYTCTDEPLDDLVQVASLGLIKAIDRFEPDRGAKFTSYAAPTILGELKRHFRDKGWALRVRAASRSVRSRWPRDGGAVEAARPLSEAARGRAGARLPRRGGARGAGGRGQLRGGLARRPDRARRRRGRAARRPARRRGPAYELVEDRDAIASNWKALSEVERKVLELRFMSDLTQREIGDRIGYSQMHVSRLLRAPSVALRPQRRSGVGRS